MTDDLLPAAQAVIVRPGDTLLLALPHPLTAQQADDLKTRLRERLPGVDVTLITGCTQIAVYRPELT